jgi:glycerol-3-phosphate dehydrogenase (NAD(P)+)
MSKLKVQVVGGGSFGLALSRVLANNGHEVCLWCREEDDPKTLRKTRHSPYFLKEIALPESVDVSPDIAKVADIAVYAVPSHIMRLAAQEHTFSENTVRVSIAKGIENKTCLRMSEVITEVAPGGPVVALSGPSHAEEVAKDLPASLVVAGKDEAECTLVQNAFFSNTFRVYTSTDIIGVELGGALKNVIAIAAGACDGLGLGDNAKAALITRGLAEMARLGVACGADPLTFSGLSGMGDLIVTCASQHSRNRAVGEAIARGENLEELLGRSKMVAEGVKTTQSAKVLAEKMQVEMPITEAVHQTLFEGVSAMEALVNLMSREAKPEQG